MGRQLQLTQEQPDLPCVKEVACCRMEMVELDRRCAVTVGVELFSVRNPDVCAGPETGVG